MLVQPSAYCLVQSWNRKLSEVREFKIEYDDHSIRGQTVVKYLGVKLGQCLSGEVMAKQVLSKVAAK